MALSTQMLALQKQSNFLQEHNTALQTQTAQLQVPWLLWPPAAAQLLDISLKISHCKACFPLLLGGP